MKIHEILFLFAGAGMIISLPIIEGVGFYLWLAAKFSYFSGIVFFIVYVIKSFRAQKNI